MATVRKRKTSSSSGGNSKVATDTPHSPTDGSIFAATTRRYLNLFFLGVILAISASVFVQLSDQQGIFRNMKLQIALVGLFSLAAYYMTYKLIPFVMKKANLFGRDINKESDDKVPESLGVVVGTVYLTVVILLEPLFPEVLGEANAALTSICFMLFLGFMDDVLDLRWSIKIFLSFLASLPLLVAYSGPTNVIVPKPLRDALGLSVELGYLYHIYMALVTVFCTNSINIYAGINGLEAVQSAVIAIAVVIHNVIEINVTGSVYHLLSLLLMVPFIATTFGLLYYNWYPSRVFVGDSYTYFAGITLAVAGILGHFSKTLMLFFLPQLLNFAISLPQLFGIVPCPRHRVPKYNPKTDKLEPTYNFTLINLYLYLVGPQHEASLTFQLAMLQTFFCALGFVIRYHHAFTRLLY